MPRTILLIRHAKSEGTRHDRHKFPPEGAPLSWPGISEAKHDLHKKLVELDIDLETAPIAISKLIRTRQTAEFAGLKNLKEYEILNEVDSGLANDKLDEMIANKQVPEEAKRKAKALLKNPPKENIWVTHGMLIASIANELGMSSDELYIPVNASIHAVIIA